jgi:hypothetical protein
VSTAARKARKREGIPFERVGKVGTPLSERIVPQRADLSKGIWVPAKRALKRLGRRAEVTGELLKKVGNES